MLKLEILKMNARMSLNWSLCQGINHLSRCLLGTAEDSTALGHGKRDTKYLLPVQSQSTELGSERSFRGRGARIECVLPPNLGAM
jgi:hypothetical protein